MESFVIVERLPAAARDRLVSVAASDYIGRQALMTAATDKVKELDTEQDSFTIYRWHQVQDVPRSGVLIFRGNEDPNVPLLEVYRRTEGMLWGYREELLASYEMVKVPVYRAKAKPVTSSSTAAPARINVDANASEELRKEAEKRDKLWKEVASTVGFGALRKKNKELDLADSIHNEIVDSVIQMEKRRGRLK